jgi:hypothetical protein
MALFPSAGERGKGKGEDIERDRNVHNLLLRQKRIKRLNFMEIGYTVLLAFVHRFRPVCTIRCLFV